MTISRPTRAFAAAATLVLLGAGAATAVPPHRAAPGEQNISIGTVASTFPIGTDGGVSVGGRLTCEVGARVRIDLSLAQDQGGGSGVAAEANQPCPTEVGTRLDWTLLVHPSSGAFRGGDAHLTVTATTLTGPPATERFDQTVTLTAPPPPGADFYLALGDSLATGFAAGPGEGYVDLLYARLHRDDPNLTLVNLGCSSESSASMLRDDVCTYPEGTQYAAAVAFLAAHPGRVKLVTIDIGGNDIVFCTVGDQACVDRSLATIHTNLGTILAGLRQAAGPATPIAGMTYFDPYTALWVNGPDGQAQARSSVRTLDQLNGQLTADYQRYGAVVADAAGAYRSDDFDTIVRTPLGDVPVNVALACTWLDFSCAPGSAGFGDDANPAGYVAIAAAFERVLGLGGTIPAVPYPVVGTAPPTPTPSPTSPTATPTPPGSPSPAPSPSASPAPPEAKPAVPITAVPSFTG